jgi:hypothetical protein
MSKLKIALIAVLVGTSIASPAFAQTRDRQRAPQSASRPDDPNAVMCHGNKIGADPDPFIRQEMLRHSNSGYAD